LAGRIKRLTDGLRQCCGVHRALTLRQSRWCDDLIGAPIRFPYAIVAQEKMRAIARKIICHREFALLFAW
jgi:hypothetical protein